MRAFLRGTAALAGLIIGVGIFGVPYVIAEVGGRLGLFWILGVGVLLLTIHLFYGWIVVETPGRHRLPGYTQRFLGKTGKRFITVLDIARFWLLQSAYLIVGGSFLTLLLQPIFGGTNAQYVLALFFFVAIVTWFGLRLVERVEFYLTGLLILGFFGLTLWAWPQVRFENFWQSAAVGGRVWFAPYGVVMVALSGAAAIPELWDIVGRRRGVFWSSIVAGTLLAVFVTVIFTFTVVGISGQSTSPEAISGLQSWLGNQVVQSGATLGLLAILTSYLMIALYLKELLQYDFLVRRFPAWLASVGVPLLLFLAGARNFIPVIDLVGSVFFGLEGLAIVLLAILLKRRKSQTGRRLFYFFGGLIALFLALGVAQKLGHLL